MKKRYFMALVMALVLVAVSTLSTVANATVYTKTTTHYYSCNAHTSCMYITFESTGDTYDGYIYNCDFINNHSHWPNAFREDKVWSYTIDNWGYAKGKYTIYSSLITAWASLAFSSTTDTITHVY